MNSNLNIFNSSARPIENDAAIIQRIASKDNQPRRTQIAQRFVLFFSVSSVRSVVCIHRIIAPAAGGRACRKRVGVGERGGSAWKRYIAHSDIYYYELKRPIRLTISHLKTLNS